MNNHKAEPLLKLLLNNVGPSLTFAPHAVQKKFLFKKSTIWVYKQNKLEVTGDMKDHHMFKRAVKYGCNFLVCFQTSNLEPMNPRSHTLLNEFLDNFDSPYMWGCGRGLYPPGKSAFSKPSDDFIEILDLDFGQKIRERQIHVQVPVKDIIMLGSIEHDRKIDVLVNSQYYNTGLERGNKVIRIKKSYKSYFVPKVTAIKNNDSFLYPGTSGMTASEIAASERPESSSSQSHDGESPESQSLSGPSTEKNSTTEESQPIESQPKEIQPKKKVSRPKSEKLPGQFAKCEFNEDFITIITETRRQSFEIADVNKNKDLFNKGWMKDTTEERRIQWNKIGKDCSNCKDCKDCKDCSLCIDFNLFDLVRNNKAQAGFRIDA